MAWKITANRPHKWPVMGWTGREQGFTLLEVLIALLVLGLGLLGLASMQAASINITNQGRLRSLAAIQANSLAAAMHANPAYWQASAAIGSIAPASGPCSTSVCTPDQLAGYDIANWANNITAILPSGTSGYNCVNNAVASGTICTIKISWLEKNVGGNAATVRSAASSASTVTYTMLVQP